MVSGPKGTLNKYPQMAASCRQQNYKSQLAMATAHDPVAEELWDEDLEIPDDGFLALPSGQRVLSKKMPANSSVPESHLTRLAGEMEPILPLDLLQPGQLGDQAERASLVTHAGSSADQPPECAVQLDPALLDGPRELGTANQSIVVNAPESRPSDSVIVVQGSAPSDDVTAPPSVSAAAETTAVTETGVVDSDISSITYVLHEEPPRLLSDDSCHNLDSAPILGPDLRSLRSSSSNFGDDIDIDFSDSVSLMGRPSSHQPLSDKQGSCASLDFLPDAVPDAPHTVAPHLLRRIMHSPAPSHGTAASNFDFEGDDLLADLEVPETFAPEGCLQRRLDLAFAEPDITEMSPESTAQRQESDLFDDLEVPEDAFALAAQRRNQQVFMDRNPSSPARSQSSAHLHTAQPIALSAVAIQVHEITELDEIEDLAVSMERETKFESVPRLPTLSKRSKSDAKDAAARGPSSGSMLAKPHFGHCNTITAHSAPNGRRIEIRSSLTAPTASFLAKMREPVKINQSSKSPNRKPKRPELIQNLGSANTVKGRLLRN